MHTAKHVIDAAMEAGLIEEWAPHYSEPSYSSDKPVLFANWNDKTRYDKETGKHIVVDNTMPRLAKVAERAGFEIEWSDEWTTCDNCGGAVRTSPDSYGWQRSYWNNDDHTICANCIDPVEYLESLEGDGRSCNTFRHIDPKAHDYVCIKDDMANGWYGGQNDSPEIVAANLRKQGITRFLFNLDDVGQFDMHFSVWVHVDDMPDETLPNVDSVLPYDPAVEMAKALRGEHSDHYRMESRELTPEEFVSGSWVKGIASRD